MLGRRLLTLFVILVGLAIVAAAVASRPAPAPGPQPAPAVEPAVREAPEASARPSAPVVQGGEPAAVRVTAEGRDQSVRTAPGRRLELEVSAGSATSVQIGEGGPVEAVDPAAPARFDLLYDAPARVPIRLLTPDPARPRVIGVVDVR